MGVFRSDTLGFGSLSFVNYSLPGLIGSSRGLVVHVVSEKECWLVQTGTTADLLRDHVRCSDLVFRLSCASFSVNDPNQ